MAKRALGNKTDESEINDSELESTFILEDLTQVLANIEASSHFEKPRIRIICVPRTLPR
ncbi:MAG: hypothetical protein AAFQ80_07375 [Cyanobacteria bacterium J06621_8]